MPPTRVLVVDDEPAERRAYRRLLSAYGFSSAEVATIPEAVSLVRSFRPEVILSDVVLGRESGITLLEFLRRYPETARLPFILMTGLSVPTEILAAASRGLGLPPVFKKGDSVVELVNRLRESVAMPMPIPPGKIFRGPLILDPMAHSVEYHGNKLKLHGRRAFDLLYALALQNEIVSREELLQSLWEKSDSPAVVNVTIMRLRRDLAKFPGVRVATVPSGYRLEVV